MKCLIAFAGQGSQFPGMGKGYYENFPIYKNTLEEASDSSGLHLKKLSFDASESDIKESSVAQPLILSSGIGMWRVLTQQFGLLEKLQPIFAGHSLGEYTALVAAGALSFSDAVKAVQKRGAFMSQAIAPGVGGMRALILKESAQKEKIENFCHYVTQKSGKLVALANWNTDTQVVISGYEDGLKYADQIAGKEDAGGDWKWIRRSIALEVSGPFHSPLMKKAEESFDEVLARLEFKSVAHSYIRNIDARESQLNDSTQIKEALKKQICGSVLWYPTLETSLNCQVQAHAEISPSKVLTNMASRIEKFKNWKFMNFEDASKIEEVLA